MTIPPPDVAELDKFFADHRKVVVITGAGISASSGIPTYRDHKGIWRHSEPIKHQEFLTEQRQRKRYWARSLRGWPAVRDARPNAAHLALAKLERQGRISLLITQNVDRLHQRAGSTAVVDLHGRLDQVRCLQCNASFAREHIQQRLLQANPGIAEAAARPIAARPIAARPIAARPIAARPIAARPIAARTKPDGDADVADALVEQFSVPACEHCNGTLIPDVVFFGGTVPSHRVQDCMRAVEHSDAVLAIGSSLQVYSGFRFCRRAAELDKTLAIINPGITRADALASLQLRSACEPLLQAVASSCGHHITPPVY